MSPLNLLRTLILLPMVGGLLLLLFPRDLLEKERAERLIREWSLFVSSLTFFLSTFLWFAFDESSGRFQFLESWEWIPSWNLKISFALDGISLFFVLLTTLIIPLSILASWEEPSGGRGSKEYFASFLLMESFILLVFTVMDLVVFYIFFEAVLIPMFLIIGLYGSRERRVRAAYFFFLYTLLGSVLMLLALLLLYSKMGTTDYLLLMEKPIEENLQYILWLAFFASFAVKVPMVPVHIWLPEAHVEAPTAGSVVLAAVLLKLGGYALIRFSLPLFPLASLYFRPLVYLLGVVAVIYTSLTAIRQSDMKRIIAYASVAHMNLTLLGLFSLKAAGIEGSILQMLSHGLVSAALFLSVGVLYERHHSRLLKYYSGLAHTMPIFVSIFLFFTVANIALPGTSSFVGEFMILLGIFQENTFIAFLGGTGMVLGGAYSLWLYNRLAYGNLKTLNISYSVDIKRLEFFIFLPLLFLTLLMGIYPAIFLDSIHLSCENLSENLRVFLERA